MNDFSEIEKELKKLRPAQPSRVLFERVEQCLQHRRASAAADARRWWRRPRQTPCNWLSLGFGFAAAVVLILFAVISMEHRQDQGEKIAQHSPGPAKTSVRAAPQDGSGGSSSSNRFIPAGATQVVYNTRDEGLQFARGSEQPLRRLRYQTHQTWQWRNPTTGASLRVSYPSEEVVLIPVSLQ